MFSSIVFLPLLYPSQVLSSSSSERSSSIIARRRLRLLMAGRVQAAIAKMNGSQPSPPVKEPPSKKGKPIEMDQSLWHWHST